jgi:eukaryotic-like serine/threonine-protein kinase
VDEAPVKVGEVLAQKYRVDRILGVGGMGVVVAATHLQLDQKVALKFMLKEAFANPQALARFQREAKAAVRLKSEHVARVSDTGTFENGSPYIVMEYLEGYDLAEELKRTGPLPPWVVAEYVVQACDALAEAHSLGIIHRDLKPANLFLSRRADGSPLVKVLDFGISKVNSLTDPHAATAMTKTGGLMGSPLYMSPEQIRSSKDVDPRTDVWSLGIIMYELLGGRVPFDADTMGGLLAVVMMDVPVPLHVVRPDTPPAISALVDKCLQKAVDARCRNVADIARGLAPFCPPRTLPLVDRIVTMVGSQGGALARTEFARTEIDASPPISGSAPRSGPYHSGPSRTANAWAGTDPAVKPPSSKVGLVAAAIIGGALVLGGLMFGAILHFHSSRLPSTPDSHAVAAVASVASVASAPPISAASTADNTVKPVLPSAVPDVAPNASPDLSAAQTRVDAGAIAVDTTRTPDRRARPATPKAPADTKPPAPHAQPSPTKATDYEHM